MATAVSWSVGTVVMFLGFGVMACSALGGRRRSRFYIRLSCAGVVLLALALGLAFAIDFSALPGRALGPLWLALLLAAMLLRPVFFRTSPLSKVRRMATVAVGPAPVRRRLRQARLAAASRSRMPTKRGRAGAITTGRAYAASAGAGRRSSRCGPAHRRVKAADRRFRSPR